MDQAFHGCESWPRGVAVGPRDDPRLSDQSPGLRRGGCGLLSGSALPPLCGTLEANDREVLPRGEQLDLHRDPYTRLTLHQRHGLGARRTPRPTASRLESRLMVCGPQAVVDLVGRPTGQRHVRPMRVVPTGDKLDFAQERSSLQGRSGSSGSSPLRGATSIGHETSRPTG